MQSNGIICEFDKAGRIIIPNIFRKQLTSGNDRRVQVVMTNAGVLLKKPEKGCMLCGESEHLLNFESGFLCIHCINKIKNL
ncbi:MAG: hypothetical protein ACI4RV_10005 [Eubacteriales bacterium]